jgi:signal transduction histidine kinase
VLELGVALLFVLLFAHALTSFVRRRDPLAGDVSLVFGPVTALFAVGLSRQIFGVGAPPRVFSVVTGLLILVLPLLTLRLVSRFRRLPPGLMPGAAALYVASAAPVVFLQRPLPSWATWFAVAVFAATELVAAACFALEGRERAGAARIRLYVASLATALFAAALVVAPLEFEPAPQVLALLSGAGYVAAFMPPRRVRSMSAMAAAHMYGRQLLTGSEQPTAGEVWRRFARAVHQLSESDAVVVLTRISNGETTTLAAAGIELGHAPIQESVDFSQMNRLVRQRRINTDCPIERSFAAAVDAQFATLVPLPPPYAGMPENVAMLLSQHRSLFSGDDLEVIRDLGRQAALLAGRAESAYEQRLLANELGETVETLHVASKAKSDLLARVSHEFRTPLTAIIGYSALLRRSLDTADPALAHTGPERIHSAGLHLLALVEEVLDLAQMDAGHFDLRVEQVELAALVDRTVDEIRPLATRKRLSLRADVPAGTVPVDPDRMRQVLYNLLSNAIKFTPAGGTVWVTGEIEDDKARVTVADTGIGIPVDDQTRVFEEFSQVAEHGPHEGTGLGLSIVRRLVAAHGGHTELESTPGEGSRFIVTLPRHAPAAGSPRPDEAGSPASAAEPRRGVGRQ